MPNNTNRIYALLVGINDYPLYVGRLQGCVNDVGALADWLGKAYPGRLALECLTDAQATRGNLIALFRTHLCQAGPDDTVLFHYSGHGARARSAAAFKRLYPDGRDEGLVCIDSREPGGFDLADKELAVLLQEVAARGPHLAVLLDCCHSGSATRGADDFTQARARFTHEVYEERPLETYLDGWYADRLGREDSLEIPTSRHILLAACERVQKAWESKDHRGVFTSTLIDVLGQSGPGIAYADLFLRARSAVRRYADDQTPQFETYAGFDAYNGFLGGAGAPSGRRYSVYFDQGAWKADCGALHGLPTDPDKVVELALYPESDPASLAGHAATTQVGAQKCEVRLLDLTADPAARFQAQVTSLPVPPLPVRLDGDTAGITAAQDALARAKNRQALGFAFTTGPAGGESYCLTTQGGSSRLTQAATGRLIQATEYCSADRLFPALKAIADWERAAALQNRATRMDRDAVAFQFVEVLPDGTEHAYPGDDLSIDITHDGSTWREIKARLRADNRSAQPLHFALAYLSNTFAVQVPCNERIEPTRDPFDLIVGASSSVSMTLEPQEGDEAVHFFKLIVSTERIDDFLLVQDPVEIGKVHRVTRDGGTARGVTFGERAKLVYENEWFTKTIRVRLVRRADRVGTRDLSLVGGRIGIKGHPSFQAGISLGTPPAASRGAGDAADFSLALERQGLELLRFTGTRGESPSVLELTDIANPDSLAAQPLELTLDLGLGADEQVLPLTFDGEDILLAGEPERDPQGRTLIRIDHIPDGIPDNRRSLGKSLKLYFFKTYLKRTDVDKLCWVEYRPDGTIARHEEGLADQVAAARNVILLVHGIIGDTAGMAQGLGLARDGDGRGLNDRFDLVLTYDYENLSGSIEDKARTLKARLQDVGLHAQDDKRLALLVHSMGGLIARWLIEREGGNRFIDHLVMCGTPNQGSPFGKIDAARNLTGLLTTWAINVFPAFAPFGTGLLTALGRSKKISPTLEQMDPGSPFIHALNAGEDPGVRYSILAGDIRGYQEGADPLLARLTAKLGKGPLFNALYHDAGHDIAVSTASIEGVPELRQPVAVRQVVACHHLNYFVSEAGLRALRGVAW
jgi:pimeloyl-ACP methyl ester carboxylesterase